MAEGGRPASELYPPGAAVPSDAELSAEPLLPVSKSSVDVPTSTGRSHASERLHPACQEDPSEATGETSSKNPALSSTTENDGDSRPVRREPAAQVAAQFSPHGVSEHPPEHRAAARTSARPHSIAEPYTSSHPHKEAVRVTNQRLLPASLPVQRSHSDTAHMVRDASVPQPPHSETRGPAYRGGDLGTQDPQGQSTLQLQHCNTATTICRGPNSGGPTQQAQGGCVLICPPSSASTSVEAHHDPRCEEAVCYGPYVHHGNPEDTFAAYCHPHPIPAPAQLIPPLAGMEVDCMDQRQLPPHPSMSLLTFPRLMSSVSETGLDAKRMLHCCNLNCSWVGAPPPGGGPQLQHQRSGGEECCSGAASSSSSSRTTTTTSTTRDMGTMTAHRELRNIGVQTSRTGPETVLAHPPPHMFPQVCLVEENGNGNGGEQNGTVEGDSNGPDEPPKFPVKEVKWDAEGMTWEVYGASVDPEELGLAIQKHLELQIKETASRAAKLNRQDTSTSRHSNNGACRRKRGGVMGSIRTPACCARSTTAVD